VTDTKRIWPLAVATTLLFTACKKDSTSPGTDGTGGGSGSITLSLSAGSLSLEQGADGTVTATIGRSGGFTGSIALSVTGAPSGVTATASPSTVASGSTSSTITVAVGSGVDAGSYTLTVHASGTGVSDVTATLTLTVTALSLGSYSLSMSPATLSIQQGNDATAAVDITRDGFAGSVTLAVSGAPSGMTATLDPSSTSGNSSTLTVAVGGSVAAADYTITITGTASGLDARTATLTVTVTAPSTGSGNTVWQFCPLSGLPAWFAYQDGTGAWTQVMPDADNRYVFDVTSGRGGVAYALTPSGQSQVTIHYGTQEELNLQGNGICGTSGTGKTVNGTVANVGPSDQAYISLGGASASVFGAADSSFQLMNVPDGNVDLIASRSTIAVAGSEVQITFNKGIIRRGLNPADGSTLPVLDFESSEAFDPVDKSLTINNLGSDGAFISESFFTPTGATGLLYAESSQSTATTRTFKTVPDGVLQAGDLNLLTATAYANGATMPTTTRSAITFFAAAADQTLTLGPDMSAVTVTSAGGSPYVMPRIQYSIQSDYDRFFTWAASQTDGLTGRTLTMSASSGYLDGASNVDLTMPDFSSVGFDGSWALAPGAQVTWSFGASGWTTSGGNGTGLPYLDGAFSLSGTRMGTTVF